MAGLDVVTTIILTLIISQVLAVLYVWSRYKVARPGERIVVYHQGRTRKRLIAGPVPPGQSRRGRGVIVLPFQRRLVRVGGDLVEGWDVLREALPWDWEVSPPVDSRSKDGWVVRAYGPRGQEIEGRGPSERRALQALAERLSDR